MDYSENACNMAIFLYFYLPITYMYMKRFFQLLLVALVAISCTSQPRVKYVFYFIGDGMGINQVMGTEQYNKATGNGPETINFAHFPVRNFITTASGNSLVTDSAAGGTALATGVKTYNGAIGVDMDTVAVSSLTEWAKASGFGTAVITSVGINHATPGCFVAHTTRRQNYEDISTQYVNSSVDFAAGAGFIMNRRSQCTPAEFEQMAADNGISIFRGPDFQAVAQASGRVLCLSGKEEQDLPYAIDRQEGDTRLSDFVQAGIEYMERNFGKKGFFMMVEGGKIDYAGHSNDAAACFQELTDMANSIDLALEFLTRHPKETLILVTADHETGGLMLGAGRYEIHPELLAGQKLSIVGVAKRFGEAFFPEDKPYKTPSWEDVKAFAKEYLGLWDTVEVSQTDEAKLKDTYEKTFGKGGNKTQGVVNLYSVNPQLVYDAFEVLDRAAGYRFSYGSHSGSPVGLYVTGAGSEAFIPVKDNAQIAPIIASLAGYKR